MNYVPDPFLVKSVWLRETSAVYAWGHLIIFDIDIVHCSSLPQTKIFANLVAKRTVSLCTTCPLSRLLYIPSDTVASRRLAIHA